MNIFIINSGSSSLKYQFFRMPNELPICSGLLERIGLEGSAITHKLYIDGIEKVVRKTLDLPDHQSALKEVARLLTDNDVGVIENPEDIEAVGHLW